MSWRPLLRALPVSVLIWVVFFWELGHAGLFRAVLVTFDLVVVMALVLAAVCIVWADHVRPLLRRLRPVPERLAGPESRPRLGVSPRAERGRALGPAFRLSPSRTRSRRRARG